jgi:hypothetical protein
MKQATIADAPAVLNTNDQAMWVLGFNAAVEAMQQCPACNGKRTLDLFGDGVQRPCPLPHGVALPLEGRDAEASR